MDGLTKSRSFPGHPLALRSVPFVAVPFSQYPVKLAIPDASDELVDSHVFVKCTFEGGAYTRTNPLTASRSACMCRYVLCNRNDPDCDEDMPGGGTFQVGTCATLDPPCEATGACCLPHSPCTVMTEADCLAAGGSYDGDYATCDPGLGRCMLSATECIEATEDCCTIHGGTWTSGEECPLIGACCHSGGLCAITLEEGCPPGTFLGHGALCEGDSNGDGTYDACQPSGACCGPDGCVDGVALGRCERSNFGKFRGVGSTCAEENCHGIPTVSEWGLVVIVLMVLVAGTIMIKRGVALSANG